MSERNPRAEAAEARLADLERLSYQAVRAAESHERDVQAALASALEMLGIAQARVRELETQLAGKPI